MADVDIVVREHQVITRERRGSIKEQPKDFFKVVMVRRARKGYMSKGSVRPLYA